MHFDSATKLADTESHSQDDATSPATAEKVTQVDVTLKAALR
jgi:hypothetical protein